MVYVGLCIDESSSDAPFQKLAGRFIRVALLVADRFSESSLYGHTSSSALYSITPRHEQAFISLVFAMARDHERLPVKIVYLDRCEDVELYNDAQRSSNVVSFPSSPK